METPEEKNNRLSMWERNVIDEFKELPNEKIKETLAERAFPFAVCFAMFLGDFNISSGIRNANAFGAKEVFYLGRRHWDRRGAVGVQNYTPVKHLSSVEELASLQDRYTIVGVDNIPRSVQMSSYQWPTPCLLVFGEEGNGLTSEVQALCKDIVAIEQFGSVRSVNCSTASGIAMYDLIRKLEFKNK